MQRHRQEGCLGTVPSIGIIVLNDVGTGLVQLDTKTHCNVNVVHVMYNMYTETSRVGSFEINFLYYANRNKCHNLTDLSLI